MIRCLLVVGQPLVGAHGPHEAAALIDQPPHRPSALLQPEEAVRLDKPHDVRWRHRIRLDRDIAQGRRVIHRTIDPASQALKITSGDSDVDPAIELVRLMRDRLSLAMDAKASEFEARINETIKAAESELPDIIIQLMESK